MPEEILCSRLKVNNTLMDDNDPFRKDLRDSSPMPEKILCYMFKVNSTLLDDSDPFRKDLRDSSPMPEEILCYMFKVNSTLLPKKSLCCLLPLCCQKSPFAAKTSLWVVITE